MRWYLLSITLLAVPTIVRAQPTDFRGLVGELVAIINVLVAFVLGLSLIVFLWGMTKAWIIGAGDEKQVEEGKKIALTGIVVFVILISVWGIVALLRRTLFGV